MVTSSCIWARLIFSEPEMRELGLIQMPYTVLQRVKRNFQRNSSGFWYRVTALNPLRTQLLSCMQQISFECAIY